MNKTLYIIAVILSAIGAINWGLVGAFNFDLVATIFGAMSILSRIVYVVVGVSGLILLFGIKCVSKGNCNTSGSSDTKNN